MMVYTLIQLLKEYPDDMKVIVRDHEGGWWPMKIEEYDGKLLVEPDKQKTIKCDNCEQVRLCEFISDPFAMEKGGLTKEEWWCNKCYCARVDEI